MEQSHPTPDARLRRTDPQVVADDPFWSVVRRRHSDVELVLLDDPARTTITSTPAAAELTGADEVAAERRRLLAIWGRIATPLADLAREQRHPPALRWRRHGPGHRCEIQVALIGIAQEQGADLLATIAGIQGRAGWLLSAEARRGVPMLRAVGEGAHLRAEAGRGACVITLRGPTRPVSTATQRSLRSEELAWG